MGFDSKSGGTYNAFSALNEARRDRSFRDAQLDRKSNSAENQPHNYQHVLNFVQSKISESEEYNRVLTKLLDTDEGVEQLKNIIFTLLQRYPTPLDSATIERFRTRIYEDMTGLGILTPYLDDPDVEEINVYGPGPKQIEIISSHGNTMLEEGFYDKDSVLNMVKRAVRMGNMVIDQSNPRVDSYMGGGTRISAMIPPIVREDKGAVASIRKQTKAHISRDMLISSETVPEEELCLLELFMQSKVSGAIVGATGSGKTTLLNYLLTEYVEQAKETTRIFVIEESRELQLPDDARVFYTAICGDAKAGTEVSAPMLLKSALRFHPTFIACAEMRGAEAMNAMTAAQTGHTVWSTFHADNCHESYQRLLTMCKMSGTDLSENLLMRNLIQAFPIIVSSQQMKDGTRKITGIYEANGVEGNTVVGHYLYRMIIDRFEYDENGSVIKIHGFHCRCGDLSDRLAQRIFDSCGRLDKVLPYARKGWLPEKISREDAEDFESSNELAILKSF